MVQTGRTSPTTPWKQATTDVQKKRQQTTTSKATYAFPVSVTPKLSPLEVFGSSGQLSFNLEKEIINRVQTAIRDPLTVSYGTPKFFNLLIFALAFIPPLVMWMFVIEITGRPLKPSGHQLT